MTVGLEWENKICLIVYEIHKLVISSIYKLWHKQSCAVLMEHECFRKIFEIKSEMCLVYLGNYQERQNLILDQKKFLWLL